MGNGNRGEYYGQGCFIGWFTGEKPGDQFIDNYSGMLPTGLFTPNKIAPIYLERKKRFRRKPGEKSQRSSSRKSNDSSIPDNYIKSPTSVKKEQARGREGSFFQTLAESMLPTQKKEPKYKIQHKGDHYTNLSTSRCTESHYDEDGCRHLLAKIQNLEAELDLKNHQVAIASGQCQRTRVILGEEKEKRRRLQSDKRDLALELKETKKTLESLTVQIRKLENEKEYLSRQILFLERINYDDKTRSLQSYREKYLEDEIMRLRHELQKSRGDRERELEKQIGEGKERIYVLESHYKAMKVANECLIKQKNNEQADIRELVLSSPEYCKLRDKYIRFLEEYKLLRDQFWAMKAEKEAGGEESLFSITASEVESDLSMLRAVTPPKEERATVRQEWMQFRVSDHDFSNRC